MSPSEGDRLPLVLAATMPLVALRLGTEYLRYLGKRRLAVREFERALLEGGMPRGPASQLSQAYREMGSLSTVLRAVRRRI